MRNLKKILALVLAFAMTFALTASAANFTDQATIGLDYVDDVNMLVELGVIAGYPDGSFGPQKNITRAEFAKMAYTLKYGSDTDGNLFAAQKSIFTDVEGNDMVNWAKGYINYCYNQKIVSGVGNNKFNPTGNITVAEAAKMILVIMGCDPAKEGFTGSNWMANVVAKAIDLGVFDGWAGDPTSLATRELVAKLMRNAVFSPVYEYSAITGSGSQLNALGTDFNKTLGEKTMGLFHQEGIVVANENSYLSTDTDGNLFDSDAEIYGLTQTNDDELSVIAYEYKDSLGKKTYLPLEIDRGLSDDMLGNLVDVYYKADAIRNNEGVIVDYANVEVIGNVLVNSKTVVHNVAASEIKVMPDGSTNSKTKIWPYIAFEANGAEQIIYADKEVFTSKVEKSVNVQNDADYAEDFNDAFTKYAYISGYAIDDATSGFSKAEAEEDFVADMAGANLSKYRFVSVDGGKTYSYLFKTVNGANIGDDVVYGSVSNYSESKGTITLTGKAGSQDLEDCVLYDGIATDDLVVYYPLNGKIVVEKVDAFSGAVESFTDDNGIVVGGKKYYVWDDCEEIDNTNVFEYYRTNRTAMNGNTKYYAYGNLIMQVEAEETVQSEDTYAVILRSHYDADASEAYVTLGLANNRNVTYRIGATYLEDSNNPNSLDNQPNRPQDFKDNAHFGKIVSYSVMADGTVDLSDNDFADIDNGEALSKIDLEGEGTVASYTYTYRTRAKVKQTAGKDTEDLSDDEWDYEYVESNVKLVNDEKKGEFPLYGADKKTGKEEVQGDDGKPVIIDYTLDDLMWVDTEEKRNDATAKGGNYGIYEGRFQTADGDFYGANDNTIVFLLYGNPCYTGAGTQDTEDETYAPVASRAYKLTELKDFVPAAIPNLYVGPMQQSNPVVSYVLNSKTSLTKYLVAGAMTIGEIAETSRLEYNETRSLAYVVNANQYYNQETRKYYAEFTLINETGLFTAKTVEGVENLNGGNALMNNHVGTLSNTKIVNDAKYPAGSFIAYDINTEGVLTVVDNTNTSYTAVNVPNKDTAYSDGQLYLVNISNVRGDVVTFYPTSEAIEDITETNVPAATLKLHEDGHDVITIDDDSYAGDSVMKISSRATGLEAAAGNAIIELDEGEIVRIFSFIDGYYAD